VTSSTAAQQADREQRFERRLIAPMILASSLNPVNSSIIAVSLVPIAHAFHASTAHTAWLVSALYLATAIGQPVLGRLVDIFGPKRVLLTGAVLTGVAGVVGTLAPSLVVLVIARIILGFGTCAGYPASMFLIREESRRKGLSSPSGILAMLSVSSQTIVVIGPSLGGLLIGVGGWRATFAVNIPLAVASFAVAAVFVPRSAKAERGPRPPIDLAGIALFAVMLVSLLLVLMQPSLRALLLLAVTAAAAIGFVLRELRASDPFLDVRALGASLPLLATYARALLAQTVAYAFLYGYTQWAEDGRGLSAAVAGVLLVPMSGVAILVSATTGRRPQIRGKLLVGSTLQLAGCLLLLTLDGRSAIWLLVVVAAVFGVPQGLNNLANQNALYFQAEPERLGSSAGLLRTFSYLGAIVASALNGAFFGATADTAGLHQIAWFLTAVAVLFLALTLVDRSLRHVTASRPEGDPA
jgi:MFS family permease